MEENVLVVPAEEFKNTFGESAVRVIRPSEAVLKDYVHEKMTFLPRSLAENDKTQKQMISYCLIVKKDLFFMTERKKKQGETRLHGKCSIGIGGHINPDDLGATDIVQEGMLRELREEVTIDGKYTCTFFGLINDNSNDVGSVHAGLCYVIHLEDDATCAIKETEKMTGKFVDLTELRTYAERFEEWSKIFLSSYLG